MGRTQRQRAKRRARISERPIKLCENEEYIALFKWAIKNGVVMDKIKPCSFPDTGRGLIATGLIQDGDVLISVPKHLLITSSMVKDAYFTQKVPFASTIDLLCLFLIVERSLHQKSFWFSYINMLPRSFNTLSYFNQNEAKLLPPFLYEEYRNQINKIHVSLSNMKQLVCVGNISGISLTFDDVRWAWNVVNTRCVHMSGDTHDGSQETIALAPLLDLLNHSSDVEIEAGFSQETLCYTIHTRTQFTKYSQVFINYGPHNNRKLFIEYGFLLPDNIQNNIVLQPSKIYNIITSFNQQSLLSARKIAIIKKYNLEQCYSCSFASLSWSLETAMKILALSDESRLLDKHLNIDNLMLTEYEESLFTTLSKTILQKLLDEYSSHILKFEGTDITHTQNNKETQLSLRALIFDLLREEREIITKCLQAIK